MELAEEFSYLPDKQILFNLTLADNMFGEGKLAVSYTGLIHATATFDFKTVHVTNKFTFLVYKCNKYCEDGDCLDYDWKIDAGVCDSCL